MHAYLTQEFDNAIQELRHDSFGRPIRKPGDLAIACMPDGSTAAVELIEYVPYTWDWRIYVFGADEPDSVIQLNVGWLFDFHHEVVGD